MFRGRVHSIWITPEKGAPMREVKTARAVPNKGLEGDRFWDERGKHDPGRDVTLVEIESIVAAGRDYGVEIALGETRRNVVVEGVPLNHLVGKEFLVGDVRMKGIRLCDPCQHLEKLTRKGVKDALENRGGLNAQILTEGILRPGDVVAEAADFAPRPK